jgi:hypothetical protein
MVGWDWVERMRRRGERKKVGSLYGSFVHTEKPDEVLNGKAAKTTAIAFAHRAVR